MKGRIFVGKMIAAAKYLSFLGFVLLMMADPAAAQKNKPVPIPLNVDFRNDSADAVTSDGKCASELPCTIPDPQYTDAYQNVRAEIYYGDFYFDTNENKGDGGRRVTLTFTNMSCSKDCPSGGDEDVYVATHYFNDLASMKVGDAPQLKGFAINWVEGTNSYVLRFNGQAESNHGNVVFTCVAGSPCTRWTAEPNGNAGLYIKRPATRKQPAYEELLSDVSMQFQMTLTSK